MPSTNVNKPSAQSGAIVRARVRDIASANSPIPLQIIVQPALTVALRPKAATDFPFRLHAAKSSGIIFFASSSGIAL